MFIGGGDEFRELRQKTESVIKTVEDLQKQIESLSQDLEIRDRRLLESLLEIMRKDFPLALKSLDQRVRENRYLLEKVIEVAKENQLRIGEIRNTQISILGGNTIIDNSNRTQQSPISDIDLHTLAKELSQLRHAMKDNSSAPEHDIAVGEVAAAEKAAKAGESSTVVEHLRKAGSWSLDVANKIGVGVAIAAIKAALGL